MVADEVRTLAEESQSAAKEIAGLIGEIQTETEAVLGVVAEAMRLPDGGVAALNAPVRRSSRGVRARPTIP